MRASRFLRILGRAPLEYEVARRSGSHRLLKSPNGYPDLRFSFHDRVELGPTIIRKILVNDVGLTEDEAAELL
jgi:predicted RNA binding protein YcfA (HicA-like mRNA interferase family)